MWPLGSMMPIKACQWQTNDWSNIPRHDIASRKPIFSQCGHSPTWCQLKGANGKPILAWWSSTLYCQCQYRQWKTNRGCPMARQHEANVWVPTVNQHWPRMPRHDDIANGKPIFSMMTLYWRVHHNIGLITLEMMFPMPILPHIILANVAARQHDAN